MKQGAENPYRHIEAPLKERVRLNAITNILQYVVTFPLMFIITPMIIRHTGNEMYGVWVLTGTILIYLELIGGLQTSSAMSIMVPKCDYKKNPNDINRIVNTLFWFYAGAALLFSLLFIPGREVLLKLFFKTGPETSAAASAVLTVSFFMFMLNFVMVSFGYLMSAFSVFHFYNISHIVFGYIRVGLMFAALKSGMGIMGVVYAQMGVMVIQTLLMALLSKKVFPDLKFSPAFFSIKKLNELLSLSWKLIINKLAALTNYNVDKLVLGFFFNPALAGFYQLGAGVAKYVSSVPEMLGLSVLIPAASELKTQKNTERLAILYNRANRYMFILGFFITGGIACFGREFTALWLGPGYENVYMVMAVLSCAYAVALAGVPAMNILNGMERIRETAAVSAAAVVLNTVLSIFLAGRYGINGALAATSCSMVLSGIAIAILFERITGIKSDIASCFFKPLAAAVTAAAAAALAVKFTGGISAWWIFLVWCAFYTAVFTGALFVVRAVDAYDTGLVTGYFTKKKKEMN